MSLGEFLKGCRERAGFKQAELAHVLNINQSDVSKIETDRKEPPTSIFQDWTINTQSMELGIAFLYGTELMLTVPQLVETALKAATGFINFLI